MLENNRLNSTEVALGKYFPKKSTKSDLILTKYVAPPITKTSTPLESTSINKLDSISINKYESTVIEANLKLHIMSIMANTIEHIFECRVEGRGSIERINHLLPLDEFIHRIYRKANLSMTNLLTALLFLVRLKEYHPSCKGTHGSGHRLFFSAAIIANKYLYDRAYHNSSWVRLAEGKYSLGEINQMECELLGLLKYQLVVKKDDWLEFSRIMDSKLAKSWLQRDFKGPENYLLERLIKNIDWPGGK